MNTTDCICDKRSYLAVSPLDWPRHCVVILGTTQLTFYSSFLHSGVWMGIGESTGGGTLRWTSIPSRGQLKYSLTVHATETGTIFGLLGQKTVPASSNAVVTKHFTKQTTYAYIAVEAQVCSLPFDWLHDRNAPWFFFPGHFLHPQWHGENDTVAVNCLELNIKQKISFK